MAKPDSDLNVDEIKTAISRQLREFLFTPDEIARAQLTHKLEAVVRQFLPPESQFGKWLRIEQAEPREGDEENLVLRCRVVLDPAAPSPIREFFEQVFSTIRCAFERHESRCECTVQGTNRAWRQGWLQVEVHPPAPAGAVDEPGPEKVLLWLCGRHARWMTGGASVGISSRAPNGEDE